MNKKATDPKSKQFVNLKTTIFGFYKGARKNQTLGLPIEKY
ncbi:hypothetical protein LEP1GSC008_0876 [Leptospira kirschneri serovar Bulgarica str. Nikolaevo]|uniref:Uncharacterized protein n=1 Tax=Leptospira kirschneri serovar Bulgarica str. Nikolaevo TaxID=1240687 RepID=M6F330_9LEPT|nr:hypothetical protein LEP1GSC008_0876 [Leptospira kirschneri serovar Bulgarica str. Nikolaevo]